MARICILFKLLGKNATIDQTNSKADSMKVIKGLKKIYKNMSPYNRRKLREANFKTSKKVDLKKKPK